MSQATLHGYYRSSTSYRTRIALNLKGIEFAAIDVRLDRGAQHEEAFRALNPMGAVPVLEIDGLRLVQSPAIIDYLEERTPTPAFYPGDVAARQRVREFAALVGCDIHPVNNLRVLQYLRANHAADSEAVGTWCRHWMAEGFGAFEKMLAATPRDTTFCVGDGITAAEIYLLPQLYNARRFDLDLDPYPAIRAIEAHCLALAPFSAAHPDAWA